MFSETIYDFPGLRPSMLAAIFSILFACSSGQFNTGGSNGTSTSKNADTQSVNALDNEANAPDSDGPALATPPQVITGAYLVCAQIQPQGDTDPVASDLAGKVNSETIGYGCGLQNDDGTKNSAKVEIKESKLVYQDKTEEIVAFSPAPQASRWHISFVLSKSKAQEIASIVISGTINDNPFGGGTTPLPPESDPSLRDFHLAFVTSSGFIPGVSEGFIGLDGADQKCAQIAFAANVRAESWRAILTNSTIPLTDRIIVTKPIKNIRGDIVFNIGTGKLLFESNLSIPLNTDELGRPIPTSNDDDDDAADGVWTGISDGNGLVAKKDGACDNWNSNKDSSKGSTGQVDGIDRGWLSKSEISCATPQRLYCISQFDAARTIFYRSPKPGFRVR
jgi:hypothetical protein